MKTKYCVFALSVVSLLMGGCSKEHPFSPDSSVEGQVLKAALDISPSSDHIMISRAGENGYNLDDFNIAFIPHGNTTPLKTFTYGEMPDIVNLPSGSYSVTASYGEDKIAEWENPYFFGESQEFDVRPMEITSYVEPIECSLQNIKVTIEYGADLFAAMGTDAYVEVKVGENSGLNFTKSERRAGYFKHTAESTLVATFHGNINGANVVETKSYSGVQKGYWYKLKFKLHGGNGSGTGNASGSVTVDATVDVDNVNGDINIADDDPLDDGERPGDDNGENPPSPPDEPQAPVFTSLSPGLIFDTPWNVNESTQVKFKITSTAESGFVELTCDIESEDLTEEVLQVFGLSTHLDLVNTPGSLTDEKSMAFKLNNFGFPVYVGGKKEVEFEITPFMELLVDFGDHRHVFDIHVKDDNGETNKKLILQF